MVTAQFVQTEAMETNYRTWNGDPVCRSHGTAFVHFNAFD